MATSSGSDDEDGGQVGDGETPPETLRSGPVSRLQTRAGGYVARHPVLLKVLDWLGWNNPGGSMNP